MGIAVSAFMAAIPYLIAAIPLMLLACADGIIERIQWIESKLVRVLLYIVVGIVCVVCAALALIFML